MIVLPHASAATLDEVIGNLGALHGSLARGDGVRYFNQLYLEVTTEVARLIASGGVEDPGFLTRLDVWFANSYFGALLAAEQGAAAAPPAWRPLFEVRSDKRVAPIQFALAGMNAHINYDLPVGVVATCQAVGVELRRDSAQARDFDAMNHLIEQAQEKAKRWLLTGLVGRLERLLGRVDDAVATWSITRAREAAWSNALTLWRLRDNEAAAALLRSTLAHTYGAFGRGLLFPSTLGLQRWTSLLRSP